MHVPQEMDRFRKARNEFIRFILSTLSGNIKNIEKLEKVEVISHLRSMLWDPVPIIQENAAVAVAKLAIYSERLSEEMVGKGLVSGIVSAMEEKSENCRKASMFAIQSLSKYSERNAHGVVASGALHGIVVCLQDKDNIVKTYGAWALSSICKHYRAVSLKVVESGVLVYAAICLHIRCDSLKVFIVSALASLSKHSIETSKAIVDSGCLGKLSTYIHHPNVELQIVSLSVIANLAMHSLSLVDSIMGPKLLLEIATFLKHEKGRMKRNAAALFRVICEDAEGKLKEVVLTKDVVCNLLYALKTSSPFVYRHIIVALGLLASKSVYLSHEILEQKGHVMLAFILYTSTCQLSLTAAISALTQIGKHSTELANSVANIDIFPKIVKMYTDNRSSKELQDTCKEALEILVQLCTEGGVLINYLTIAPVELLKYCLKYFSEALPKHLEQRRRFLLEGGLSKIQLIAPEPDSVEELYINIIKASFPEDMVAFYAPEYFDNLVLTVETFKPKSKKEGAYIRPSPPVRKVLSLATELDLYATYGFVPQSYFSMSKFHSSGNNQKVRILT